MRTPLMPPHLRFLEDGLGDGEVTVLEWAKLQLRNDNELKMKHLTSQVGKKNKKKTVLQK